MGLIDSHLDHTPSKDSVQHGSESSPLSSSNTVQPLDVNRRAWIRKSPSRHHFRTRKHGGPRPTLSLPTYDGEAALERSLNSVESQLRNRSSSDNVSIAQRTRGLSNLFKPWLATKTLGKGMHVKGNDCKADMV